MVAKMENKYSIHIFWSKEDQGFIAEVEELDGCSAFGETREEAFKEIQIAMKAWIDSIVQNGESLPEPQLKEIA